MEFACISSPFSSASWIAATSSYSSINIGFFSYGGYRDTLRNGHNFYPSQSNYIIILSIFIYYYKFFLTLTLTISLYLLSLSYLFFFFFFFHFIIIIIILLFYSLLFCRIGPSCELYFGVECRCDIKDVVEVNTFCETLLGRTCCCIICRWL